MAAKNCSEGAIFYLHSICLGVLFGIIGPSLPDLRCLFGVSLQRVTSLLLWFGVGGVSGQVVVVLLLKRMPTYLLLASILTITSLSTALLPASGNIYYASLLLYLAGLSTGQALSVLLHQMNVVWPGNAKTVHLLFASAALGPAFGPLILGPFLSDGVVTMSFRKTFVVYNKSQGVTREPSKFNAYESDGHVNRSTSTIKPTYPNMKEDYNTTDPCHDVVTLIQYPYLMFAFMRLPAIVGYIFLQYKARQKQEYDIMPSEEGRPRPLTEWFFITLMCAYFILAQGSVYTYSSLLTSFGFDGTLHLSLNQMAVMTSTFWFSFTAGRVSSLLPHRFKHIHIIIAMYVAMFIGHICLCLAPTRGDLLWPSTVLIGFSTGPLLSAGLTWSRETISMSPNIITAYIAFTLAAFILAHACGFVMGEYGPNVFLYFLVGIFGSNIIVLVFLIIVSKYI